MKERPIIFSTEMVKAILDSRKTQTRRVIKPQPYKNIQIVPNRFVWQGKKALYDVSIGIEKNCPYGQVGEGLWVRETFHSFYFSSTDTPSVIYKDGMQKFKNGGIAKFGYSIDDRKWRPPIHMPRWASRITLEITDIRVERLKDISHDDCFSEGIISRFHPDHNKEADLIIEDFRHLWNSIHKKEHRWEDNPWVWVISFKRLNRN